MDLSGRYIGLFLLTWIPSVLQAQVSVELLGRLPEEVRESSGLLLSGNTLLTHNDSGNEPLLYELDTASLQIRRRVTITGVANTDWEDLAEDENYLYIADIGNNLGQRQDLKVLRVSKAAFETADEVPAEVIAYRYEDQTDFADTGNSDWDAEALVAWGDSLLIFTKQWKSGATVAYSLPKTPGEYLAHRLAEYPVRGLVTAASPDPVTGGLVLLGYSTQLQPFSLFVPVQGATFSFPASTKKELLDIGFGQTEGLTPAPGNRFFVSSESYSNAFLSLPASIFILSPETVSEGGNGPPPDPNPGTGDPDGRMGLNDLRLYRAPGSPILEYALEDQQRILARAVYDATGRTVLFEQGPGDPPGQLDISALETSVYYLALYVGDRILSRPFLSY